VSTFAPVRHVASFIQREMWLASWLQPIEPAMRLRRVSLLAVTLVTWVAAPADAQWLVAPYVASNVAGDVEQGKGGPGVSTGYLGDKLGFEFDLTRYQHFFKDSDVVPRDPSSAPNCGPGVGRACTDIDTDAAGFMGNVVLPVRIQVARKWLPFASAGFGMIRAWTNEEGRAQNNFAFNVGGGLTYSLNTRVGLRADMRYVRALGDENSADGIRLTGYGFVRASVGVTVTLHR
jgi:hypothetical protein